VERTDELDHAAGESFDTASIAASLEQLVGRFRLTRA
jgi:hypothetical protein